MSLFIKITVMVMAFTRLAAADTPKNKAPKGPAKGEASKLDPNMMKPEMPKPPAEIEGMAKSMVGNWKCSGTTTNPDGTSSKMTGRLAAKVDLDKWWISDVFEGRGERGAFKMVGYSTFDASSKKWRRVSIDNMGHQYIGTSDGMKEGKLTWNLDFLGAMGAGQFRDTVDASDPKAGVKFAGTMSVDKGKSWRPVYEMTCKK